MRRHFDSHWGQFGSNGTGKYQVSCSKVQKVQVVEGLREGQERSYALATESPQGLAFL